MPKRDIHVVPHNGEWATRREGSQRVSEIFDTQRDAYDAARRTAQRERVEVVRHRPDGRIRDADSFGKEPHPPRDKQH